jgi:hypothetical protein
MTVDIEAGGALATAGLAATAIEGESNSKGKGHPRTCANCHAPLAGRFCHSCGQTAHVHRSIWHMLEEGLHGVLHFDSKMWRTLPLLVARPGLLTRRYIDGQRVRFVTPLALFLFTIFLMFFVLSFVGGQTVNQASPQEQKDARAELAKEVDEAKAEVTKLEASLAGAKDDEERGEIAAELDGVRQEQRTAEAVLSVFDKTAAAANDPKQTTVMTGEELKAVSKVKFGDVDLDVGDTANGALKQVAKNPELAFYKFKNTAYKFSFMLIPISLPFLWLMFFWKKDVTTYDHMVFSMYSLSFMSLLFVLMVLMGMTSFTSKFVGYLAFVPPLHMFLQLKETYRLKFFSALWRTFALLVSAGTVFVLFLIMIAAITAM